MNSNYEQGKVCIQPSYFIFFVVVCLLIISWALYQVNNQANEIRKLTFQTMESSANAINKLGEEFRQVNSQKTQIVPPINLRSVPINIPTQGDYGNFQQVGYAYKTNKPDFMFNLLGRKINSYKYEYYVIHPYTQIRMPIKTKNDWELSSDDDIKIPGFTGNFRVHIYEMDSPRYL
jgi:hypothetical protein